MLHCYTCAFNSGEYALQDTVISNSYLNAFHFMKKAQEPLGLAATMLVARQMLSSAQRLTKQDSSNSRSSKQATTNTQNLVICSPCRLFPTVLVFHWCFLWLVFPLIKVPKLGLFLTEPQAQKEIHSPGRAHSLSSTLPTTPNWKIYEKTKKSDQGLLLGHKQIINPKGFAITFRSTLMSVKICLNVKTSSKSWLNYWRKNT